MSNNEEIKIGLSILATSILGICLGLRTRTMDAKAIVTTKRRRIYSWSRI